MPWSRGATVSLVLLGVALAIVVPALLFARSRGPRRACGPRAFAHAAVAADSKACSEIGRSAPRLSDSGHSQLPRVPPPSVRLSPLGTHDPFPPSPSGPPNLLLWPLTVTHRTLSSSPASCPFPGGAASRMAMTVGGGKGEHKTSEWEQTHPPPSQSPFQALENMLRTRPDPLAPQLRRCKAGGSRDILQQHGSPVDAAIAALVCTGVVNPQSMGLGGGVVFTIYNASTGKVEIINAREMVPAAPAPGLLDQCEQAQPLGTGAQWIGVPGELRGYAEAHRRHGRLPWAQLLQPTIALLRKGHHVPLMLSKFLNHHFLRPSLYNSSLRQLFFNGTEPLKLGDPLPWPKLAATLETVAAEGAEALYTGGLARALVDDVTKEGAQLTLEDLATFHPEVVEALEVPLGDFTLYSPPPPAGGAILSFILNVLRGFNFSAESVARPEGSVDVYHRLVETLKFAGGQRWRLWDPRSHLQMQNASEDLLGEALAQHTRQQIDARGDHPLSHYSLAGAWGHGMGTTHVSVLGEDGSAVAATSTINLPFGAMVYSPRTGLLLNNELLDLCWRRSPGSGARPPPEASEAVGTPARPSVPGERPPSSMAPSILLNAAQGSKLVIGGAGGDLIISAMAQAIMNKLWLGFDLRGAIEAPILHVNSQGQVEYEPKFNQEVQRGLQERGHSQEKRPFFLNVVQAVSQEGACVYAVSDLRKGGEAAGY
ncbi:glutathione hydrolase 5 proenzyme [Tamandua tetradactyla]|uniref:glutathione hydrolase 5 proenzyme n=1 Tax=Tamandua tetradactyla TaxID=48850 RepID=UPI0040543076